MTATDLCRQNLYRRLGVDDQKKRDPQKMAAEIEGMKQQLRHMMALAEPRLVVGGIRYGSDWQHDDLMNYMRQKFDTFRETGNMEMLVDLINLAVVESKIKTHPQSHFKAKDRQE